MRSLKTWLVRLGGARALMVFGDSLVVDRWRWIRTHLPREPSNLVDAGCGNGWLALNCARLGHRTLGLGWDDNDLTRARSRADILNSSARFEVQDLRDLASRPDLTASFDVVTCTEVIEHIIDDSKLMANLAALLRPGGQLLLTAPSSDYIPMDVGDAGPFEAIEDGRHVRKGYSPDGLRGLAEAANLRVIEIAYCSGRASQQLTRLLRALSRSIGYGPAWALTVPLRAIPLAIDRPRQNFPPYSICMVASKG
jgi:SAM-dependent methyltransferase